MNYFKNLFHHRNIAARVYSRKQSRLFYIQSKPMSHLHIEPKDKEAFYGVLPEVINSMADHPAVADVPDLESWIKKLLNYNLLGGKAARGQTVVMAYETLASPGNITEESIKMARILGWCVEMFQAYLIILDDIMDESKTRRGRQCWHLVPGVGTSCAINDSILLFMGTLYLLRKNFSDRPNYGVILNTINEALLICSYGQFLDIKTSEDCNKDYTPYFTPERYYTLIKCKTAHYTYYLPIYLGYLLNGDTLDEATRKQIENLGSDLGTLFQIQDDYIDCYGDESLSGKYGTDIQNGKCSWLAVNALQRCNTSQRLVFNVCYGSIESAHIQRIKVLYDQLKLPELFKEVEKKYYDDILEKIKELPSEQWKVLFNRLLGITYQRKM